MKTENSPSSSTTPMTGSNPSASKSTSMPPSPKPSCIPAIPPAIDDFRSVTPVTDNPILASGAVPPQHAPQTFQYSCRQAENGDLVPIPSLVSNLVIPEISAACEANGVFQLPQEPTGRLNKSVQPELASIIPADSTDKVSESPAEPTSECALSFQHSQHFGFEPLAFYMGETDVEARKRSETRHSQVDATSMPSVTDKEDRTNDNRTENQELRDHLAFFVSALQHHPLQSIALPSPSTPLMVTTSTSHDHRCTPTPAASGEEGAIVREDPVADVLEPQVSLGPTNKSTGSTFMSLAKWKWRKCRRSMDEEEALVNDKSDPGVVQESRSSNGDRLSRTDGVCSREVNCELISSTPTDKSAVTITQLTSCTPSPVARPECDAKYPVDTTFVAVVHADNAQQIYRSIQYRPKPKFTIGDLEEVEFPVNYTATEVHDEPEQIEVENSITAGLRPCRDTMNGGSGARRWTVANALTDEKISDAGLVKVLDRMRDDTKEAEEAGGDALGALDVEKEILEGWGTGNPDADGPRDNASKISDEPEGGHATLSDSPVDEFGSYTLPTAVLDRRPFPKRMNQHVRSRSTPSHAWLAAQRALLTCRELILTERHYIAQLSALVQQHTVTPPPPLMCDCAKELLAACGRVLRGMEKDPSARGVARAFLEGEEEVQGAYVRWCGVVGGWFSGDGQDSAPVARSSLDLSEVGNRVRRLSVKRRNRVGSKTDVDKSASPVKCSEEDDDSVSSLKRTVSTWRKSMPSLGFDTPSLYSSSDRKKDKENEREAPSSSTRKLGVRELAILPTQRVMRYALIYQELLSHTPPTSPSRTYVELAAHAAARVAEKCDLAQGNAAFIATSSSTANVNRTRSGSRTSTQMSSRVPPLPMIPVSTGPLALDTPPASPISIRSMADSPSRLQTQHSTSNQSHTEVMTASRRSSVLHASRMGKINKQKIPVSTESTQAVQSWAT